MASLPYIEMALDPFQGLCEVVLCVLKSNPDVNIEDLNTDTYCTGGLNRYLQGESRKGYIGFIIENNLSLVIEEGFKYIPENTRDMKINEGAFHCYEICRYMMNHIVVQIMMYPNMFYNAKINRMLKLDKLDDKTNTINNIMKICRNIFPIERNKCGSKYMYSLNTKIISKFPDFVYKFKNRKSKGEVTVDDILKSLGKKALWNPSKRFLVPGATNSKWDFVIYDENDKLIGFCEVDGHQHYNKNSYFNKIHKKGIDFAYDNRLRIDKLKDEYAVQISGKECLRIDVSKNVKVNDIKKLVCEWIKN
jgi:hypothetical protein